jgi:dienelactone hydrolase
MLLTARSRLAILHCFSALLCACSNTPATGGTYTAGYGASTAPTQTAAGTAATSPSVVPPAGGSAAVTPPLSGSYAAAGSGGAAAIGGNAGISSAGAGAGAGASAGASGSSNAAGSGGGSASNACNENILPLPEDPAVRGPWDVGVRTVTIGRLTTEVVYPAEPGSTTGKPETTYNLKNWLPTEEQSKIPDDHSPDVGPVGGHFYRDVPIDAAHGPYPVVIFIHGTSSMRIANMSSNAHWASRGFVVIAADYPGLTFSDQLKFGCGTAHDDQDIDGDLKLQMDALNGTTKELDFLTGRVDMKRLGLSGHSQGACMSATHTTLANVQIIVPLTGSSAASPAPNLKSIMWIAGMQDKVIGYDAIALGNTVCPANPGPAISNVAGYTSSPGQPAVIKRLVGLKNSGHLNVTDLCQTNAQGKNAVQEAVDDGVCGVNGAAIIGLPALNDCGSIAWEDGVKAVNYVSTIALEETLHCLDRTKQFAGMQAAIPAIADYRHEP